jgi:hypothetical protein
VHAFVTACKGLSGLCARVDPTQHGVSLEICTDTLFGPSQRVQLRQAHYTLPIGGDVSPALWLVLSLLCCTM